ncbi:Spore germination protein B3 [Paenibacillus solanacearum]|uniref:Spore germination protein B3 n=1 Tax=Paenibacillus solanacearum TaxID=2048548 RepID=A0A916NJF6_9BACL|nr:Ger(x)C family spore germination protein [Paenibacillus solanacearum]CAG7626348.1 Spore germination protein B3 [Paenibacillus solanacearum]
MLLRKLTWRLLPASLCLLLLPGCWSRIEINDRAFVTAMYMDKSEEGIYEVSLGFPLPNRLSISGGEAGISTEGGNPYTIVTKTAESIPVAIRKIRSDLSRELSWGHCRVIVVGETLARQGLDPLMEFVAREPNFHTKSYLMVAPGLAKDISKLTPVFERFPNEVLREFARRRVTLDTSVKDVLEAAVKGGDSAAALLTIGVSEMLSEKGKRGPWVGTDGAALIRGGRMIGKLNVQEMRAGLWIQGKMKNSVISLDSPTDGKPISFIILSSHAKIRPVFAKGKLHFEITIEAEDDVMSSESTINLMDPDQVSKLETLLSEQLIERIERTLRKTRDEEVDAFGLGWYVDWRYPKVWEQYRTDWRHIYKNTPVHVTAHVVVKRTGVESKSITRQRLEQREITE